MGSKLTFSRDDEGKGTVKFTQPVLGYKFKIHGRSDSDYATNPDDCRGISEGRVFMNNVPISFRGITQKFVTLSVTEAKIAAGVMVAQDILYVY